jgi:hypothetical protein
MKIILEISRKMLDCLIYLKAALKALNFEGKAWKLPTAY